MPSPKNACGPSKVSGCGALITSSPLEVRPARCRPARRDRDRRARRGRAGFGAAASATFRRARPERGLREPGDHVVDDRVDERGFVVVAELGRTARKVATPCTAAQIVRLASSGSRLVDDARRRSRLRPRPSRSRTPSTRAAARRHSLGDHAGRNCEDDLEQRRVRDRVRHVGARLRPRCVRAGASRSTAAASISRDEPAELVLGDGGEQFVLAREVVVERGRGDAETARERTERECVGAVAVRPSCACGGDDPGRVSGRR